MGEMTPVTVQLSGADVADLEQWARNSERTLGDLLNEAVQAYLRATRDEYAELDRRSREPAYSIEEVEAYLRERRRPSQVQAAE